jgi:hypothetical protein
MAGLKAGLYLLALLTCMACTVLLMREYFRTRVRLLLWSTLCFVGLSLNNALLFADLVVYPTADLRLLRAVAALVGMGFLLYGFIWDTEA